MFATRSAFQSFAPAFLCLLGSEIVENICENFLRLFEISNSPEIRPNHSTRPPTTTPSPSLARLPLLVHRDPPLRLRCRRRRRRCRLRLSFNPATVNLTSFERRPLGTCTPHPTPPALRRHRATRLRHAGPRHATPAWSTTQPSSSTGCPSPNGRGNTFFVSHLRYGLRLSRPLHHLRHRQPLPPPPHPVFRVGANVSLVWPGRR